MRIALIVNPGSGGGTSPDTLAAQLEATGARVDVHTIADLDHADVSAADRIVVASGDGAVGYVASRAADEGKPLAVIPSGTANDFARAIGIPRETEAAVRLAADPEAATQWLDLGCAGTHPFVNVASCGMSVVAMGRSKRLKGHLGPLAYPVGAISAGATAARLPAKVTVDGEVVYEGPVWQVLVAGTGAFGGGAVVGPVEVDDRKLDVAIMVARGRHRLLVHALRMRFGGLTREDDVLDHRGRHIQVEVPGVWNVDGERLEDPGAGDLHVQALVEVVTGRAELPADVAI